MIKKTLKKSTVHFVCGITSLFAFSNANAEFRTLDGHDNNLTNPSWGTEGIPLVRDVPAAYSDGISSLAGDLRPSAREVSNIIAAQDTSIPSAANASDYLWQWGQWLDHDVGITEGHAPAEPANIPVPLADAFFDPASTGLEVISFSRSKYDPTSGTDVNNPRQQVNDITAWIDASNVYGSNDERATALRLNDGTGKLKLSSGSLLPFNESGLANAGGPSAELFVAGDIRANEQVGLAAMHTLWVREHNRKATEIAENNNGLSGNEIFEEARAWVGALQQVITYNEFLPILLGPNALAPYTGYDETVDGSMTNTFTTGIYRIGHTMLSGEILRVDKNGHTLLHGDLPLRNAFFNPSALINEGGIDPVLRGLAAQTSQEIDSFVVDDVRNFLFGAPGQGGLDLVSLNVQRGRDHGLGSFNETRAAYGLPALNSFDEVSNNPLVSQRLALTYESIEDADLWITAIAEDHAPGALVGETAFAVLKTQFEAVRDGDRFWYQSVYSGDELAELESTTLADVIIRNTGIDASQIQENVFIASPAQAQNSDIPAVLSDDVGMLAKGESLCWDVNVLETEHNGRLQLTIDSSTQVNHLLIEVSFADDTRKQAIDVGSQLLIPYYFVTEEETLCITALDHQVSLGKVEFTL